MFEDFTLCQICEHNPTGERCELFGRVIGMHGCSSGIERKPRNNFEAIKALSMEEMAEFFMSHSQCDSCFVFCNDCGFENYPCDKRWLEWLKEEIPDAETE